MNRDNAVNEVVRVLSDTLSGDNIYPDTYTDDKEIPCIIVTATEEIDVSMPDHSMIDLELIIQENNYDLGAPTQDSIFNVMLDSDFRDDILSGGLVSFFAVERQGVNIERDDNTTETTLEFRLPSFNES